jgi:hypothetical protein
MSSSTAESVEIGVALADACAAHLGDADFFAVDGGLAALDDRDLAERLQVLERLSRQVEHAIVAVVAEADRRCVWAIDGHRSVRGWCQATVNWSGAETTHRIRTVRVQSDLRGLADALASGKVGVAQVRELARARANPRCGEQLADCADVMVENAHALPFDEFRQLVDRWEALADADGAHRGHEQTHAARRASIERLGDGYAISGECGVAQGATMAEILERFCEAEFHADWDEARTRLGDAVTPSDLARNAQQRRMDALHAIFLAAAAASPGSKAPEPVVEIVVDQATFEAALTAMATGAALDECMPPAGDPARRRCETIDGDLVDPCDAVVAALIGHIHRVVFGSASCTIDLGVASRL